MTTQFHDRTVQSIEAERDALETLSGREDRIGAYARRLLDVVE